MSRFGALLGGDVFACASCGGARGVPDVGPTSSSRTSAGFWSNFRLRARFTAIVSPLTPQDAATCCAKSETKNHHAPSIANVDSHARVNFCRPHVCQKMNVRTPLATEYNVSTKYTQTGKFAPCVKMVHPSNLLESYTYVGLRMIPNPIKLLRVRAGWCVEPASRK